MNVRVIKDGLMVKYESVAWRIPMWLKRKKTVKYILNFLFLVSPKSDTEVDCAILVFPSNKFYS